ncbi:hypothetical protein RHMOL_Rhmol01G0246500 [Rhododendron molle]|uniref:Uncharacterized protein n=1 Tax=Rhododendron molle TaxID=49168 RepID=A0ACC0Q710_RHOML|nr:hypothetical protein RHMOL_Rhmol01G0246500 [Rhododendron molle]
MELEMAKRLEEAKKDPGLAKKHSWKAAVSRAAGDKVHDDPKLLKVSMSKEKRRHEKNAEKWKDRVESREKVKGEKKQKRAANIAERIHQKKMRKIAKREKKLMRPGFEGRKEGFNIVGQWAVTTSVDFSLAQLIQVIILLSTGGKNGGGYTASRYVVIAIHGGILLLHAFINSLPISRLSLFGQLAAAWNLVGVFVLMILIPTVATETGSPKFVFTYFNTNNGEGISGKVYIFDLGLLMSQYTLTGYDASSHMGYLLGITFAVTDIPYLLNSDNDAGGYAIAEVFYLAFKRRYGSGAGGIICLGVVAVAIFFSGMSSITSNSRMAYAFSRDGAMPLSSLWHKVNKHEVPINAVWLSAFIAFCMALTSVGSLVVFQAMVSIATIGLYIAYTLPIFFRITLARKSFTPGPFNLGRYGVLIGWIAVLWVATISVLFSLPVSYPITDQTINYTPVAVGGLLLLTVSSWIFSARHWFKGPITNINN